MGSEEDREHAGSQIISWYDSTRPRFIDLVGDYAGQELFLIEGDGLLREAFGDERLDFSGGFQILHAVYIVEKLLEGLLTRHCNFHVAFFEDHKMLCVPSTSQDEIKDRYLLARSIIIRHLSLNLVTKYPGVKILSFDSVTGEDFQNYLETTGLHFVMLNDGALSSKSEVVDGPKTFEKETLRAIIAWFNKQGLNVALINRIEIRDTKVFTMILETLSSKKQIPNLKSLLPKLDTLPSTLDPSKIKEWFTASAALDDQSERMHLAMYTIATLLSEDKVEQSLASAFLLHVILMEHLKLSQRGFASTIFEDEFETKIQKLLTDSSIISNQIVSDAAWKQAALDRDLEFDLVDLFDGRLFKATICALARTGEIPAGLKDEYEKAQEIIETICRRPLSRSLDFATLKPQVEEPLEANTQQLAVLPFVNKVFDKHLSVIQISTDKDSSTSYGNLKIYRDTTHWHNRRPIVQKKPVAPIKITRRRNPLRTHQFYMAEMTAYAASLTGASGKALTPETIIVGPRTVAKPSTKELEEDKSKDKKPNGGPAKNKKGAPKKPVELSKADKIRAANTGKKAGVEQDKAFSAWQTVMKGLNTVADDQQRYLKAKAYLAGLDSKLSPITADVLLFQLQSLLSWWAQYCKTDKANGYHVVAVLWTVAQSFKPATTTKEIATHVVKVCNLVGIPAAAESLQQCTAPDRKLSFTFQYPSVKPPTLRIELSQTEFQLLHCGPYMDRSTDGKPDARVTRFVPDAWQRKVLDELDANRSIFVVAPTSSGKTFISFYAMEQVLRANNDDILVYVAPTKSLVNQIAAEVQANFRKSFPQAGKCVWAIHTRDYRINNPGTCQILVTVPHILQIMLLAPSNAKSWAPRVKRIIFDEIHSIGQADDGVVWEQLLLLSPCPIIALSATVGNPEQFRDWLVSTQKACGTELTMIQHHTRYSDLRKYTYIPPKTFDFNGLGKAPELGCALGLDGLTGLNFFHPIASLVDKTRGMPTDLSCEPRDCLLLYKAMVKFQNDQYPVPKNLAPEKALPAIIKKADTFKWEKDLKAVLLNWMADRSSPFDKVVEELSPKQSDPFANTAPNGKLSAGSHSDSEDSDSSYDPNDGAGRNKVHADSLFETTLPLLVQLHQRNALPAILFNYDRGKCEALGENLLKQLTEAEDSWKKNSTSWKKTMRDYEKYQELKEAKQSRKAPKVSKSKGEKDDDASNGNSKDSRMRDDASGENSFFDLFDPKDPLEDFSFADKKKCQREELQAIVKQLRYKNISETLISLLYRGIGVHHSGMNRKYRQCVEMLFRKAFLRVVIATGTLSLGINMPCATVVFSGDSVFLTALNFRQAAGRSGRRGFDALGNVVFQNIPRQRVCRLLSSRLPDLTGHFPITTSLVLRLCSLLHESKDSPYAQKAIDALLSQPRMYLGGESFKEQVLHHLRFSLDYLRRQKLLGPNGEPVNMTSCISHLYFTENSAFAFHALLKSNYLSTLCADIDTKPSMVLRTLMLVMSHLFGRKGVREVDGEEQAEKIRASSSMVYLEPLPEEAVEVLRKHNKETLEIFAMYAKTFSEQHLKDDEDELPLTRVSAGGLSDEGSELEWLQNLPKPVTRSAFVALSGHTDKFQSIGDLCTSTRAGIFLEEAVIPYLPEESRTQLNSYLLDFFMHGALQPLEDANGIRKSDVWFDLNDFSLVLATIVTSLGNYLGLGVNPDLDQLDVMGSGDVAENDKDEDMAEDLPTVGSSTPSVQAATDVKPAVLPTRRKVANDWNTEEDALVVSDALNESDRTSPIDDDEEYAKLTNVYKAFQMLKVEFDTTFRKIWA